MTDKTDNDREAGFTDVPIPTTLYRGIERRLGEAGFDSVSSYVAFVLREVLAQDESGPGEDTARSDDEKIKERLRSLGYLD